MNNFTYPIVGRHTGLSQPSYPFTPCPHVQLVLAFPEPSEWDWLIAPERYPNGTWR